MVTPNDETTDPLEVTQRVLTGRSLRNDNACRAFSATMAAYSGLEYLSGRAPLAKPSNSLRTTNGTRIWKFDDDANLEISGKKSTKQLVSGTMYLGETSNVTETCSDKICCCSLRVSSASRRRRSSSSFRIFS